METWDAITSRRQVRSFTDQSIPDAVLRRILDGARLSPSGSNRQPWDFVVVSDGEQKKRLSAVWKGAAFTAGAASVVALVLPVVEDDDARSLMNRFDLGQAALQLSVVAADQGVGSGLAACRDQVLARDVLALPDDRFVAILVALGYPEDRAIAPMKNLDRRPFDEVVHYDRW